MQIFQILSLHHIPLHRKNNQTKQENVRCCHVLNGRLMPLVLDLMTRTQVSEYYGDFPKGGKGGSVSSVGGIGVSEAMQFLYFFFSFWSPEQPRDFLYVVLGQNLSIILSGSPKAMQLTKPNFRTCLEALRPSTLLKP